MRMKAAGPHMHMQARKSTRKAASGARTWQRTNSSYLWKDPYRKLRQKNSGTSTWPKEKEKEKEEEEEEEGINGVSEGHKEETGTRARDTVNALERANVHASSRRRNALSYAPCRTMWSKRT